MALWVLLVIKGTRAGLVGDQESMLGRPAWGQHLRRSHDMVLERALSDDVSTVVSMTSTARISRV